MYIVCAEAIFDRGFIEIIFNKAWIYDHIKVKMQISFGISGGF